LKGENSITIKVTKTNPVIPRANTLTLMAPKLKKPKKKKENFGLMLFVPTRKNEKLPLKKRRTVPNGLRLLIAWPREGVGVVKKRKKRPR